MRYLIVFLLAIATVSGQLHVIKVRDGANTIDDSEILAVLMAIDQGEIDLARYAMPMVSGDAREYAQRMIRDHTRNLRMLEDLGMDPRESEITDRLRMQAEAAKEEITDEESYMERMVMDHRNAIMLTEDLAPAARELRPVVDEKLDTMKMHYDLALEIRNDMDNGRLSTIETYLRRICEVY